MKRASLSVLPPAAKTEPADLTDRLLDREAATGQAPAEHGAESKPKRRAAKTAAKRRATAAPATAAQPSPPAEPESVPTVIEASDVVGEALRQAEQAAQALDSAARVTPARFHLALRYRLDALAHHLRQVGEFVAALSKQ